MYIYAYISERLIKLSVLILQDLIFEYSYIVSYQLGLVFPSFGSKWCSLGSFKNQPWSPNRILFLVQKVLSYCKPILTMTESESHKIQNIKVSGISLGFA